MQCHLDQTPRRIFFVFHDGDWASKPTLGGKPQETEHNEMKYYFRKVEMLKEACEMLSGHAQQLEEMARILI